jgi:hypothetical protein
MTAEGLEDQVVGLEDQVVGLEDQVVGLEDQVVGLEDQVVGLEDQVEVLEDQVVEDQVAEASDRAPTTSLVNRANDFHRTKSRSIPMRSSMTSTFCARCFSNSKTRTGRRSSKIFMGPTSTCRRR